MSITAKYPGRCSTCHGSITPGDAIEWDKATKRTTHATCPAAAARTTPARGKNWDPQRFNGYRSPRGGYVKTCKTDGNCSSFGDGRSCGGHDCDGW